MTAPLSHDARTAGTFLRPLSARMSPLTTVAAGAGAIAGGAALVELAGTDAGPELCVVRRWLGGYCPGCGAARACRHLLHGDVSSAWADHPWVVIGAAQLATVSMLILVAALISGRVPWRDRDPGRRRSSIIVGSDPPGPSDPLPGSGRLGRRSFVVVAVTANLVLLGLIWAVRVAHGDIPSPV